MEIKEKTFKIIVKPNSAKDEIVKFDNQNGAYRVNIKEKAENNKANIEIIKFFSKLLKKKVKIIKGLKSKEKILKEFLNKLASIDIKDAEDIVDLEHSIDNFMESIEV